MTRVTSDVDVLNELFTSGLVAIVGDVFTLVGIVIAMTRINPESMGVTFSVLPLIVLVTLTFRVKVRRSFRDIRTRLASMNVSLNENLSGMATVQMLGRERRATKGSATSTRGTATPTSRPCTTTRCSSR